MSILSVNGSNARTPQRRAERQHALRMLRNQVVKVEHPPGSHFPSTLCQSRPASQSSCWALCPAWLPKVSPAARHVIYVTAIAAKCVCPKRYNLSARFLCRTRASYPSPCVAARACSAPQRAIRHVLGIMIIMIIMIIIIIIIMIVVIIVVIIVTILVIIIIIIIISSSSPSTIGCA